MTQQPKPRTSTVTPPQPATMSPTTPRTPLPLTVPAAVTAPASEHQALRTLAKIAPLAPPRSGQRTADVADTLKRYILQNRLPAGTRLPTERELAETLVVGRNLLREALNSLVALGLVEKRQGSGIYVRGFDTNQFAEQLSVGLREDAIYVQHMIEARIETEVMLVGLAARRITEAELTNLHHLLERMHQSVARGVSQVPSDIAFHQALIATCGNPVLERIGCTVLTEYFHYTSLLDLGQALTVNVETVTNHAPILAALAEHDPFESMAALRYHFRRVKLILRQQTE